MDWQDKRIHLYVYICQQYDQKHLWFYTQRMSNNDTPTFTVAQDRANGLPKAEYIGLTGAAEHDLTALRQVLPVLRDGHLYGDKIYADQPLKDTLSKEQNLIFETPVKRKKGQESLTEAEKDFSRAVSSMRQPIAALFSWMEQKTNLSMASRVRSEDGLLVHVFGRLTAACFLLAFYS